MSSSTMACELWHNKSTTGPIGLCGAQAYRRNMIFAMFALSAFSTVYDCWFIFVPFPHCDFTAEKNKKGENLLLAPGFISLKMWSQKQTYTYSTWWWINEISADQPSHGEVMLSTYVHGPCTRVLTAQCMHNTLVHGPWTWVVYVGP